MNTEVTQPPSRRRTNAQYGMVNFPTQDARWRSTGEGGMFVKLVVVDDRDYDASDWTICCGAAVVDMRCEEFIGDDQAPMPVRVHKPDLAPEDLLADFNAEQADMAAWEARHFPRLNEEGTEGVERYLSRGYLATMVLGNTGWSGYSEETSRYWQCSYEDLTPEGKALYEAMQKLYRGCTIHLLTFLDT